MIYALWIAGSVTAFLALRHFALRDFGVVTVGGLIGLTLMSLLAPAGLLMAVFLAIATDAEESGVFGRPIWTRRK